MDALQHSLNSAMAELPTLFLENLISKKLQKQGISRTKQLSKKIAAHILSGTTEAFRHNGNARLKDVSLVFDDTDAKELSHAIEHFRNSQLHEVLLSISNRISKKLLIDLKAHWPNEYKLQETDVSEFRNRLEERWGKPLGQLRMLLTISREWAQQILMRNKGSRKREKPFVDLLVRLHVRACQVTDEIICLLENGFSDGAMARWRTLHEIAVVATIIADKGDGIAERYIAHQAVESKRALEKYEASSNTHGYKPFSTRQKERIERANSEAIAKYGKTFKTDYGWAAFHLKKDRPTFADLEMEAGRADMRPYYQMGNDNVHAGVKSMYVRLGLLNYDRLLAGRSNAGLMDPGQNAAHTLTQLSILIFLKNPTLDDLVTAEVMRKLRDEVPQSFNKADKKLRRDDKKFN